METISKNIIANTGLGAKSKFINLLQYYNRKRGAAKSWEKRHDKVFELHPGYRIPCDEKVELKHQSRWGAFRSTVDMSTLRICCNLSGRADDRIIPEDIFVSDIEPVLMTDESCHFLSHKSFYNQWFPGEMFPKDYVHCINGQYVDAEFNRIGYDEFKQIVLLLPYPVVMKPNRDSFGGKNVFFVENSDRLVELSQQSRDFVIQEQIMQHAFFSKYNPVGLNTIRVYIYKSVRDNTYHIINMALRMGKGGSLDNETSGGIHTFIHPDGQMNNYAVDKYATKYDRHPDTGYAFDEKIPAMDVLKKLCEKVASRVYFTRIIGLDVCYTVDGKWRIIELNTRGHTIRFSQYGGQPFFGEFTDEVIEYCQNNHWALNGN